jgi:hypothetical protein
MCREKHKSSTFTLGALCCSVLAARRSAQNEASQPGPEASLDVDHIAIAYG